MFAALAQFERSLIVERTKAGLVAARARGRLGGRPAVSPDDARVRMAKSLHRDPTMRPGGLLLIRQLNSALDIPGVGGRFEWHTAEAIELHAQDRSFFYRSVHLGRRR